MMTVVAMARVAVIFKVFGVGVMHVNILPVITAFYGYK